MEDKKEEKINKFLNYEEKKRDGKGRFKGKSSSIKKMVYILIDKTTYDITISYYKKDIYSLLNINQRTFNKYLDKGEYKNYILRQKTLSK